MDRTSQYNIPSVLPLFLAFQRDELGSKLHKGLEWEKNCREILKLLLDLSTRVLLGKTGRFRFLHRSAQRKSTKSGCLPRCRPLLSETHHASTRQIAMIGQRPALFRHLFLVVATRILDSATEGASRRHTKAWTFRNPKQSDVPSRYHREDV